MIHFRSAEKSTALDVIKLCLSTFIMPHATLGQKTALTQHVAAMDAKAWMDVQAQVLTGLDGHTRVVIDLTFEKAGPQ